MERAGLCHLQLTPHLVMKASVPRAQEAQAQAHQQAAMEQAGGFGGRRLASASTGNLDELYQQHAARMDSGSLGNGFGAGGGAGGGGMRGAASASQLWDAQMQVRRLSPGMDLKKRTAPCLGCPYTKSVPSCCSGPLPMCHTCSWKAAGGRY